MNVAQEKLCDFFFSLALILIAYTTCRCFLLRRRPIFPHGLSSYVRRVCCFVHLWAITRECILVMDQQIGRQVQWWAYLFKHYAKTSELKPNGSCEKLLTYILRCPDLFRLQAIPISRQPGRRYCLPPKQGAAVARQSCSFDAGEREWPTYWRVLASCLKNAVSPHNSGAFASVALGQCRPCQQGCRGYLRATVASHNYININYLLFQANFTSQKS